MNYNYYQNYNTGDFGPYLTGLLIFFAVIMIIALAIGIITTISWWKIFEKAGKPGWASLIPFYNVYIMLQITALPEWLIILLIIPYVNAFAGTVIYIFMAINLAKAFNKDTAFAIGLVLLPFVFYPILGFSSKEKYVGL